MNNTQLAWLLRNARLIRIRIIEKELNIPEGILKKFIDGRRDLPAKWEKPVADWVRNFRK